jgi:hypothetical protein
MVELEGDLFEVNADWLCITTNGVVNSRGLAVMGRGVAKQAAERYSGIDQTLGNCLLTLGNRVHLLGTYENKTLVSFPTKHHWRNPSTLELIEASCHQLRTLWLKTEVRPQVVALPRPGCENGKLEWTQVKPVLERVLVEPNFFVISLKKSKPCVEYYQQSLL